MITLRTVVGQEAYSENHRSPAIEFANICSAHGRDGHATSQGTPPCCLRASNAPDFAEDHSTSVICLPCLLTGTTFLSGPTTHQADSREWTILEIRMRVLLINTNQVKTPQITIPLGVCYVASAVRNAGHEVDLLDLCFERHPATTVRRVVEWIRPEVIGLSIRNLDNCDYLHPHSFLPEIRAIAQACQACGPRTMIIGGSAVGHAPSALARYLHCQYAISGEGEVAFPALLMRCGMGQQQRVCPE